MTPESAAPEWLKALAAEVMASLGVTRDAFVGLQGETWRRPATSELRAIICYVLRYYIPPDKPPASLHEITAALELGSHASVHAAVERVKNDQELRERANRLLGALLSKAQASPWSRLGAEEIVDACAAAIAEAMHDLPWKELPPGERKQYRTAWKRAHEIYELAVEGK